MSQYMTYDELMREMDDRDDSNDPEYRNPDGYCEHGVYVGGCGPDWMCQWCEDGISAAEVEEIYAQRAAYERRESTRRRLKLRLDLAAKGYKLSEMLTAEQLKQL